MYYLVQFQKKQIKILPHSGSKINAINLGYTKKQRLKIWKTNVRAQKIHNSTLKIFRIVIANSQVENKASKPRFF